MPTAKSNEFKNVQWAAAYSGETETLVTITEQDTWVSQNIPCTQTSSYNELLLDGVQDHFITSGLTGVYLLNISFTASGGGAMNDNMAMRFDIKQNETNDYSYPAFWMSKGGNAWSINHSQIMRITDGDATINTNWKNIDDASGDFYVYDLTWSIMKMY